MALTDSEVELKISLNQEAAGGAQRASAVFPKFPASYQLPVAASGDGAWIVDTEGKRYLDGSGGVFVAILGHSPAGVGEAIAAQAAKLNFAYSGDFTTGPQEQLARMLTAIAPKGIEKAWLTTSGSTANETAMKLSRQYHLLRGSPEKVRIISREHSYHGSTVGALSMTGSLPRRMPFEPYLLNFPKISPPYCYRCQFRADESNCVLQCANELEIAIKTVGAQYVSAFIVEPVAGAPLGGLTSSPAYMRRIREICDRYDVLLIVDEVVSGLGRTGSWFGIEESGVTPDLITLAKGLGGGYLPIGAVLAHERVHKAFEEANASVVHSESFTGHVLLGTAGVAVLEFIEKNDLLEHVAKLSQYLEASSARLADCSLVGDIRGRGLVRGVELVADKKTKRPFDRQERVSERVAKAAAAHGVLLLTGNGAADGVNGDTVVMAPPYVATETDIDLMVSALEEALNEVAAQI
ncbi:aminotransferase family protein [Variovorax boronicumulans]